MPTIGTAPKYLSELVSGPVPFESDLIANYYIAKVDVEAIGADVTLQIGSPLVYDTVNTVFVPYVAQDISAVTASSLPDLVSPVCVFLGPETGAGMGDGDTVILTGATETVTVLWRGPFAIKRSGLVQGSITNQNMDEFVTQLQVQGIAVTPAATLVTPSHVDYT